MGAVDDGGLQGEENGSSGWWQWQFMVVGCKKIGGSKKLVV